MLGYYHATEIAFNIENAQVGTPKDVDAEWEYFAKDLMRVSAELQAVYSPVTVRSLHKPAKIIAPDGKEVDILWKAWGLWLKTEETGEPDQVFVSMRNLIEFLTKRLNEIEVVGTVVLEGQDIVLGGRYGDLTRCGIERGLTVEVGELYEDVAIMIQNPDAAMRIFPQPAVLFVKKVEHLPLVTKYFIEERELKIELVVPSGKVLGVVEKLLKA